MHVCACVCVCVCVCVVFSPLSKGKIFHFLFALPPSLSVRMCVCVGALPFSPSLPPSVSALPHSIPLVHHSTLARLYVCVCLSLSIYRLEALERYMFQNTETTFAKRTRNLRGITAKFSPFARGQILYWACSVCVCVCVCVCGYEREREKEKKREKKQREGEREASMCVCVCVCGTYHEHGPELSLELAGDHRQATCLAPVCVCVCVCVCV
jgi:hypothetical protein